VDTESTEFEASPNSDIRQGVSLPAYPLKLLIVPAVVLLIQLSILIFSDPYFINHDCAFLLHGARLIMAGKQPFIDFIDIVPPLAFYFLLPFWTIVQSFSIPVEPAWSIFVWTSILVSFLASLVVVRQPENMLVEDWISIGPLLTSFLLLNLVFMFHLGQREHLFVLAFFVVFLIRWQRSLGTTPNSVIAYFAGCACSIICFVKPHFLLIVFALETYWLLLAIAQKQKQRYRLWNAPEVVAGVTVYLIGLIVSGLIPNIHLYYQHWLPLVFQGYGAFDVSISELLFFTGVHGQLIGDRLLVIVFLLAGIVMIRRTSFLPPLLLWTICGWSIYVIQGKGWAYHSIPLSAGYYMVSGVVTAQLALWIGKRASQKIKPLGFMKSGFHNTDPCTEQPFKHDNEDETVSHARLEHLQRSKILKQAAVLVFIVYGMLLIPTSGNLIHTSTTSGAVFAHLDNVVARETSAGDPVMIISTNFLAAYPMVVHMDRVQVTRYMWSFPFPMLMFLREQKNGENWDYWDVELNKFFDDIAEDMVKNSPKLIAIDTRGLPPIHQYVFRNQSIVQQLHNYVPLGETNGFSVWKLKTNSEEPSVQKQSSDDEHD
jgi:hypothetical protein